MYIVFDIGGTKMRIAKSEDGTTLSEVIVHQTSENFKDSLSLITKSIKELAGRTEIKAIAGGMPGVIDRETGTVLHSPNLRSWESQSLKQELLKLSSHVFIENDAAMVALGEAVYGAGKGYEIMAYITISTGVGGARIVNDQIDVRRVSFEPGQQIIDSEALNSLENLISGRALQKKYAKEPRLIEDESIWKKAGENLAVGLHNTILHWSPDVIVLGGPMVLKKPGINLSYVKEYLKSIMIMFPSLPELKYAALEDGGGLYGSLEYIRRHKL